jgi:excisionase family DNA binding protein
MAKMYYTEDEAAAKLGVGREQLDAWRKEGKLRAYADGPKRMFKVEEVDKLGAQRASQSSGEVVLTPADSGTRDAISLSDTGKPLPPGKEDTVITSDGISIFDEEDLEVAADPMAKTAIAPSVDEQVSVEGVGSGSGLLDLTRESDDTSLGEVLDHIDVDTAPSSGVANMTEASISSEAPMVIEPPTVVEEADAASGAFSGMVVGACLLMMVIGVVGVAVIQDMVPDFLVAMQNNLAIFLVVGVVVCGILAGVGFAIGKNMASRAAALQRIGS